MADAIDARRLLRLAEGVNEEQKKYHEHPSLMSEQAVNFAILAFQSAANHTTIAALCRRLFEAERRFKRYDKAWFDLIRRNAGIAHPDAERELLHKALDALEHIANISKASCDNCRELRDSIVQVSADVLKVAQDVVPDRMIPHCGQAWATPDSKTGQFSFCVPGNLCPSCANKRHTDEEAALDDRSREQIKEEPQR